MKCKLCGQETKDIILINAREKSVCLYCQAEVTINVIERMQSAILDKEFKRKRREKTK